MAALYTAAVAPTRPWLVVRVFRCRWMRPTGNCNGEADERAGSGSRPHVGSIRPCPALQAQPEGERDRRTTHSSATSPWNGGKRRRGALCQQRERCLQQLAWYRWGALRPPLVTCNPALCERDTAFALAFPLSFPAFPPACGRESAVSAATQLRAVLWPQEGSDTRRALPLFSSWFQM